ncbi:type II secretion system GspH family protein [Patescibacteria group bacterium]|nr:type II secretion system GspH family protein [Patescibacteria group bacterium]
MELPLLKRNKAFTLIELMISVTIIAIVSAGIIPAFSKYIRNQNLRQAQEQLKSDLRSIQNKALTGALSDQLVGTANMKYWGVKFINNSTDYQIFIAAVDTSCPDPIPPAQFQGSEGFSDSITVRSATGCIFFDVSDGGISGYVSPITLGYSDSELRSVIFISTGLIYSTND